MKLRLRYQITAILMIASAVPLLSAPARAQTATYDATHVLGQSDFTTSASGITSEGLRYPYSVIYDDIDHRLFVTDAGNNRVLVYTLGTDNSIGSKSATYVLGQPDFTSRGAATAPNRLRTPYGIAYDKANRRLFVDDSSNSRILIFDVNPATIKSGQNASTVLGQSDFTSSALSVTRNGLNYPDDIAYDANNNRLFVNDNWANRIVVFDVDPNTVQDGANATHVLGQSNFTSDVPMTTASGLRFPGGGGIAYDALTNRIFVIDGGYEGNHRVLTFDVNPATIQDGASATHVLGQPDFTTGTAGTTAATLRDPDGDPALDAENSLLFVPDSDNNRVMVFDIAAAGIQNGQSAIAVLGQSDYTSGASAVSRNQFHYPAGLAYDKDNRRLFVTDYVNNRLLVFSLVKLSAASFATTRGSAFSGSLVTTSSQGSLEYSLSSGALPPGVVLDSATGVLSGTPARPGNYTFAVKATDTVSPGVSFVDRAPVTVTVTGAPAFSRRPVHPLLGVPRQVPLGMSIPLPTG